MQGNSKDKSKGKVEISQVNPIKSLMIETKCICTFALYTWLQYPFASPGFKIPPTATLAMPHVKATSSNSSSSSPFFKVHWFFERAQKLGILWAIIILIIIFKTIVVLLMAMEDFLTP